MSCYFRKWPKKISVTNQKFRAFKIERRTRCAYSFCLELETSGIATIYFLTEGKDGIRRKLLYLLPGHLKNIHIRQRAENKTIFLSLPLNAALCSSVPSPSITAFTSTICFRNKDRNLLQLSDRIQ